VRVIAESLNDVCAERLTPNRVWRAEHRVKQGEWVISPERLTQVGQISVSSVRRMTPGLERANRVTRDMPMKRIPGTKPRRAILKSISCITAGPRRPGMTFIRST
jgi:hypothetical protein